MSGIQRVETRPVTDILVEAGVVTREQIELAVERRRQTGQRIGMALVEIGAASEEDIGWALARQFGVPFVDVVPEAVDHDLVRSFPEHLLRRVVAVPLVRGGDGVSLAITDPTDRDAIVSLREVAGGPLVMSLATHSAIENVLDQVWGTRTDHARLSEGRPSAAWVADRSGTSLLQLHVSQALAAGASEIHFVPGQNGLEVQHRIGRRLVTAACMRPSALYGLLARLESLGGPVIDGSDEEASGRAVCPLGDRDALLDVSLVNCESGVAVTLRTRVAVGAPPALDTLGLDPVDVAGLWAALEAPAGLILVSGPPRSGGSTTLSALFGAVPLLDRRSLAIERPTGTPLPATIRIALDPKRAAKVWEEIVVGQSPDVIAVDDVFAGERVRAVLSSALSGRLLLATTDWSDSFDLIDFLLSHRQSHALLARRLVAVVQQRRIRGEPDSDDAIPSDVAGRASGTFFEVLIVSDAMRQALERGEGGARLRALAAAEGFQSLADRMARAVETGQLDAVEAARVLA